MRSADKVIEKLRRPGQRWLTRVFKAAGVLPDCLKMLPKLPWELDRDNDSRWHWGWIAPRVATFNQFSPARELPGLFRAEAMRVLKHGRTRSFFPISSCGPRSLASLRGSAVRLRDFNQSPYRWAMPDTISRLAIHDFVETASEFDGVVQDVVLDQCELA